MKTLTLKISNCSECPHFRKVFYGDDLTSYYCFQEGKNIIDFGWKEIISPPHIEGISIPDWCPLEEAKG